MVRGAVTAVADDYPTVKFLVVEDDEEARLFMALLAQLERYEFLYACNDSEARDALIEHRPQIIIMDMKLPDGSLGGIELAKWAKAVDPTVQIVGVSGDPMWVQRAQETDCFIDTFVKPYPFHKFLATLHDAAERAQATSN